MKKTWHTIFLILLICLDAALLLLPLLPGYRALFDIGPYPGRPPAFRFLKLAGYALFFPLTAYGCGRLLARIRKPRLRWLPAAVFALIATALVCLHNNELHMLCQLDSGWVHVPHMYENLVRADLTYRGGIGIFRYVLPWAGTFLLCGNADLLVVEDLEAFVCGTEQWQRVCAFFFQNIIEDGTDVIAAADDPAKTAPEFWYRMTCACPFSVRTLKE